MINHIFPLFDNSEIDEAIDYMVRNLISNTEINLIQFDPSMEFEKEPKDMPELLQTVMTTMAKTLYGVNAPQMANFLIVQKLVEDKLKDRLANYMNYVGIDGYITECTPSRISTQALAYRIYNKDFRPLDRWNPNILWDFCDNSGKKDISRSLTNPLNGFLHMYLVLKEVDNKKFIMALNKAGLISFKDIYENNFYFRDLCLQLLPYNNFNKVLSIAQAIFRYY